jgi:hypothetical protein
MPVQSFNPISEAFEHMPPQRPGTVVVSFHNGEAKRLGSKRVSIREKILELLTARVLGAALGISLVLLGLLGVTGFLISMLLAVGFGTYLVLNRKSPLTTFLVGETPTFYLVDVSPHTILDERRVQLADTGIYANVAIEYRARVMDPTSVVEKGISDVRDYLSRRFYTDVARIAAQGTLNDKIDSLRRNLNAYAQQVPQDELIAVEEVIFDVGVEGAAAEQLARLSASSLQKQGMQVQHDINAMERAYYQHIISDDNALLAEMMRPGADKATLQAALRSRLDTAEVSFNQKLTLVKMAFEHGVLEQHQIRRDYPEFFGQITNALSDLTGGGAQQARRLAAGPQSTPPPLPPGNGTDPSGKKRTDKGCERLR